MLDNGFYANTMRLLQHSFKLREQERIAQSIYEQLQMAKRITAPEDISCYNELLEQLERLIHYFSAMSVTVENMSAELEQLSLKITAMLEENAYWNRNHI